MNGILITGSSGYIGGATALLALQEGFKVIGIDLLAPRFTDPNFFALTLDLHDTEGLLACLKTYQPTGIIHCAAQTNAREAQHHPELYYQENVVCSLNLLTAMVKAKCNGLVFSSSASVYGNVQDTKLIDENTPCQPLTAYGKSKLMVEQMLIDFHQAYALNSLALRYFNVAGSANFKQILWQENHTPETHLLPIILHRVQNNLPIQVFGTNFPTHDGSAVRDFVHILDVARANLQALSCLKQRHGSTSINICTQHGTSVKEAITLLAKIKGQNEPKIELLPSNSGDPASLVGKNEKAKKLLNWQPQTTKLELFF